MKSHKSAWWRCATLSLLLLAAAVFAQAGSLLNGPSTPPSGTGVVGDFYLNTGTQVLYGPKTSQGWPSSGVALRGNTILNGGGPPSSLLGTNGDFYIDLTNSLFYGPKSAGLWGSSFSMAGTAGRNGNTVLSGQGNPSSSVGNNGDYYIDSSHFTIYGPKANGSWPVPGSSMLGVQGLPGIAGTNGRSILSGENPPAANVGNNGDFYIDTLGMAIYGPKNAQWPASGTSIIGSQGSVGPTGPTGATGAQGPVGPAGPTGPTGPQGIAGLTGQQGPQGIQGAQGIPGTAGAVGATGRTILNGLSLPNSSQGNDGDFYLNTSTYQIYGPKASGNWPSSGVSLVGPSGSGSGSSAGLLSLNGLTGGSQTFSNDTNIAIASLGTQHAITWLGTLAKNRQYPSTVYTDSPNSFTGVNDFSLATVVKPVPTVNAAPSGSCSNAAAFVTNLSDSAPNLWECFGGTWTKISGSSGSSSAITGLIGDVIATGPGSVTATLKTVNPSFGTCGDASHICQITTDAAGRTLNQAPIAAAGGGGSGAQFATQLADFQPGTISGNQVTFGAGTTSSTPSFVRFNKTIYTYTTPTTLRLNTGSASETVFYYVLNGQRTLGYSTANTYSLTGFENSTPVSGVIDFPDGSVPLAICNVVTGSILSCADRRAPIGRTSVPTPGTGLSSTTNANGVILLNLSLAPRTVGSLGSGAASDTLTSADCGATVQLYPVTGGLTETVPAAGSSLLKGCWILLKNDTTGTGSVTLTPQGGTFNLSNASSASIAPGGWGMLNYNTSSVIYFASAASTALSSVNNDTNLTGTISGSQLTLNWAGTLAKSRLLTTTVFTDQANTFTSGTQDFSSALIKLPAASGYGPTADGSLGVNTSNHTLVFGVNGATAIAAYLTGSQPVAGDCAKWGTLPGQLIDGGTCASGSASAAGAQYTVQYNAGSGIFAGVALPGSPQPLIGATAGAPAFGQINLTSMVTGILPVANLPSTLIVTTQANTYTAGTRQTFIANATTPGFSLGSGLTSNPTTPGDGDIWTRSDLGRLIHNSSVGGVSQILDDDFIVSTSQNLAGVSANYTSGAVLSPVCKDATGLNLTIDAACGIPQTSKATSWGSGQRQTFTANGTTAGFALTGVTADPSSKAAGDIWNRSDLNALSWYSNATVRRLLDSSNVTGTYSQVLSVATTLPATTGTLICLDGARNATSTSCLATAAQLPSIARSKSCEIHIWGSGTSSALQATDDEAASCFNDTGSTMTITAVRCYADNSSTTTTVTPIVTGGSATSILTGALTCGNGTFAAGTLNGTPTLAAAGSIDANVTVAGTAKSVRMVITGTF